MHCDHSPQVNRLRRQGLFLSRCRVGCSLSGLLCSGSRTKEQVPSGTCQRQGRGTEQWWSAQWTEAQRVGREWWGQSSTYPQDEDTLGEPRASCLTAGTPPRPVHCALLSLSVSLTLPAPCLVSLSPHLAVGELYSPHWPLPGPGPLQPAFEKTLGLLGGGCHPAPSQADAVTNSSTYGPQPRPQPLPTSVLGGAGARQALAVTLQW